jgi:hypothetical protein
MIRFGRFATLVILAALVVGTAADAQDDDDAPPRPAAMSGAFTSLTAGQRQSAGIVVAHPTAMKVARRTAAFGQVLDPTTLVSDFGQVEAAQASERAANADLERLQGLYRAEATSSLKMVQAARSEQIRARTQYQAASSTFTAHWGAVAKLPADQRDLMIQHAANGRHLLVRASILGRQSLDTIPVIASLEVDGLQIPAHVVGALAQGSSDFQSASLLLEVDTAPQGLGPGARMPVRLVSAQRTGAWIPDDAIVYGEQGAHVFKQIDAAKPGTAAQHAAAAKDGETWQYAEVPVELLQKQAAGWLVRGLMKEDQIVVRGVGALWTLQSPDVEADDDD